MTYQYCSWALNEQAAECEALTTGYETSYNDGVDTAAAAWDSAYEGAAAPFDAMELDVDAIYTDVIRNAPILAQPSNQAGQEQQQQPRVGE